VNMRAKLRGLVDTAKRPLFMSSMQGSAQYALDGIPMADQKTGHGTALANLARRLALTYGERADFFVESNEEDTCMRIELPLDECM